MSPEKYLRTFDRVRALVKRKYHGRSTRIDFEKPRGNDRDRIVLAKRPANDRRSVNEALDDLLRRCGLRPLGDDWTELSRERAFEHLATALEKDLVFHIEQLPRIAAEQIARGAIDLLPAKGTRYFTNDEFSPKRPVVDGLDHNWLGFHGITNALQDTGLVIVDDVNLVLIWFENDD
jgi:hypothetical protein